MTVLLRTNGERNSMDVVNKRRSFEQHMYDILIACLGQNNRRQIERSGDGLALDDRLHP